MTPAPDTRAGGYGLLIFSISLAIFMSGLDGTIVNIALPAISESFNVSATAVSWVATSYLLVMVGCVLVFGKIADVIGFRRIFLAVLLGAKVIPAAVPSGTAAAFDRAGALLAFTGLVSLVFVVSEGDTLGWTSPVILLLALLAIGSLAGFVRNERAAADPLLDLSLFRSRNFFLTNLLLFLVFFSFSGINYLLPFYLKYVSRYDTSTAGLILTSLSFAMMAAGYLAGQLFNRLGPRLLCIIAGIPLILGYFMMTRLHTDTTVLYIVASLLLIGFELGLMVTPVTTMIMMSVPKSRSGMISSLTGLLRTAPLSIGIATFNLIFTQGVLAIARNRDVTMASPAALQLPVLAAGFDFAFLLSLVLGIVVLAVAVMTREEVHPDYAGDYQELVREF